MTVTVNPAAVPDGEPQPGDVLQVPTAALLELGVPVDPQDAAVEAAARWAWDEVAAEQRDASLRLVVAGLAGAWVPRRCATAGTDLRPTVAQVLLGRRLVRAAGEHPAGLVAHVCAWVMPAEFGGRVAEVHRPEVVLGLYQAWCWPPDEPLVGQAPVSGRPPRPRMPRFSYARAVLCAHVAANAAAECRPETEPGSPARRAEEAELVAWRLGTSLGRVRWADGTRRQAEITGALALWEAWRADLPRPARQDLAAALAEAWDVWMCTEKTRVMAGTNDHGSRKRGVR